MRIKEQIAQILLHSLSRCLSKNLFTLRGKIPPLTLDIPRLRQYGDLASNVAFILSLQEEFFPGEVASFIVENIEDKNQIFKKIEVAGPGFINFFLKESFWYSFLEKLEKKEDFYSRAEKNLKKIQIEFVSANPTGPLHIGHGRGAALGDVLANVLEMVGYKVFREYYINDLGNQMETLGKSVFLRYQQLLGKDIDFPPNYYQGSYIMDIAREIILEYGKKYLEVKEEEAIPLLTSFAAQSILEEIKEDLKNFGIRFNNWFRESELFAGEKIAEVKDDFQAKGYIYQKDGALWFKSSAFGDEKDRVIVKSNGSNTYFISDIAYHKNKLERGFDKIINIWGADHHGYVPRLKAAIQALGKDKDEVIDILLVQLVSLLREGKPVAMSTRSGEFTTLREVLDEVGKDAARYFFLTRRSDSHLEFDLELAKKKNDENPLYYVQYAHARICSIFKLTEEKGLSLPQFREVDLSLLNLGEELALIKQICLFPDLVEEIALSLEPHRLTTYLAELGSNFHSYYNKHRIVSENLSLTQARLYLLKIIYQTLRSALDLLGVSAPEKM